MVSEHSTIRQLFAAAALLGGHLTRDPSFSPRAGVNKYTPHQGAKECARRVRQMARDQ